MNMEVGVNEKSGIKRWKVYRNYYLLHLNKVMRTLIKKTNYYIFSINRYILYCTAYLTEKQRTYFFRQDAFFYYVV